MDGINEESKPITEKINFQLLITTVVFMVIGFIYFIQKLRRLFQPFNFDNNNVNNNFNNNANINQNNINSNANQNMQENINNNLNNNERMYPIIIEIDGTRHHFSIKLADNIGQFVREKLYPLTNNRNVFLFYQGQILNQTQPFSFYEHRIIENMVILCRIRENNNDGRLNNNHYADNIREREQQQLRNDPRSVSIYSIITHISIMFIFSFIVFSYKNFEEIFTKETKIMVQILSIIWALSFSNSLSKLIFYKKISY